MKKFLIIFGILIVVSIAVYAIIYITIPQFKTVEREGEIDSKLSEIYDKGYILFGTEATFPPMEFMDEQGNFVGIDIEIAKKIAQDLGVRAEFKHIDWEDIFDELLADNVDALISSVTILPERAEVMAFSNPYFNAGQIIMIREGDTDTILSVDNLYDKRLAAQADTTGFFEAQKISEDVRDYLSYQEATEDLLAGELDAIIIDYPAGIDFVKQYEGLALVGEPFTQEFYGIAINKGNEILLEKINQSLTRLKRDGSLEEIINRWVTR